MPLSVTTVVHVRHASSVSAVQTAAGPARILEAGLVDRLASVAGPVELVEIEGPRDGALGAVAETYDVTAQVAGAVRAAAQDGRGAVILAGSCHVGLGGFAGIPGPSRGVIWMDAHGDFNTPATSPSGLVDGTVLAAITGRAWQALSERVPGFSPAPDENVVVLGVRSLDEGEERLMDTAQMAVLSPSTLAVLAPPILRSLGENTEAVYLHVDLDVLDASVGRANAWAGAGGLSAETLVSLVEQAVELCSVRALGIASYDPAEDPEGAVARVAVEVADRAAAGWGPGH